MNSPLNGWVVMYNICKLAISIFMICTDSMVKAALYSFSNPHLTKLSWYIFIHSLRIHYPQPALLLHYSPRVESMKTHQPKYSHCLHLMANYNSVYFSNRVHLCMHIIYIQPKCMQQCVVYGCTPAKSLRGISGISLIRGVHGYVTTSGITSGKRWNVYQILRGTIDNAKCVADQHSVTD